MTPLDALAQAAGVTRIWHDADGRMHQVADDTLVAVLAALGLPAHSEADQRRSLATIAVRDTAPPALLSGDVGQPVALPQGLAHAARADILFEDGSTRMLAVTEGRLPPIATPGYHRLTVAGHGMTLAIAPRQCLALAPPGHKRWGLAVQIPALRADRGTAMGTLEELGPLIDTLAHAGGDAVMMSPVHALRPGLGDDVQPYTPSSRLFLNGALAAPLPDPRPGALIDWGSALPRQFDRMRADFAALGPDARAQVAAWGREQGPALHRHACFEALHRHFALPQWQAWPAAFHTPDAPAVQAFAHTHADDIALHIFIQHRAHQALAKAQTRARQQGMAIGLIADLAVGIDPGGSDSWAMQETMLRGLTIGAPPDPLGPMGQDWGLTGFSPHGLRASGFAPFIAMVRAALAQAGGVRIDHAFGLQRLWVIPQGHGAHQGAYLSYPLPDLLRLVAIEAARARAIVMAEDLGTHPPGFAQAIAARGMAGMRVLWFEREANGAFADPRGFAPASVAMTGTHDTPTVAGWWRHPGHEADRAALWSAIGAGAPQPLPQQAGPVVDAALAHVGRAASQLAIAPMEDVLALEDQVNIPGTSAVAPGGPPNWRRRLAQPFPTLAAQPDTARRLALLNRSRSS